MKYELSSETVAAMRKKSRKAFVKNLIKSCLWWGITLSLLFFIGSNNSTFNYVKYPAWFWLVFALLVVFPVLKWKLYRVFKRDFCGKVVEIKNGTTLAGKKENVIFFYQATASMMANVPCCTVFIEGKRMRTYKFDFLREDANFANEYYQVGDEVFLSRYAKFPFNRDRAPDHPFCVFCGGIGTDDEEYCTSCGVPYTKCD